MKLKCLSATIIDEGEDSEKRTGLMADKSTKQIDETYPKRRRRRRRRANKQTKNEIEAQVQHDEDSSNRSAPAHTQHEDDEKEEESQINEGTFSLLNL